MLPDSIFKDIVELSPFPVYVISGEDLIITVANDATLKAWGRDKTVIGKRFEDALPELKDQPFKRLLEQVFATGGTYYTDNDRADLLVDGTLQTFYFKFTYQAMKDENGITRNVLCFATDVTELERARQAVDRSRQALYNMVVQAPVGLCIINVPDLKVEVANDSYLDLVGKGRELVEGRPIWDAVPEAAEGYKLVLESVIKTGITYFAKEHAVRLVRNGTEEIVFIDFVYEPIKDTDFEVNSVMVIAIDVTDKVKARKSIEEAEQRARLAIEAAEIGTFEINLLNGEVQTSERFNQIFGFESPVNWDRYIGLIHPDDRAIRDEAHLESQKTKQLFYEVRIIRPDQTIHWIRAQGRTYQGDNGSPGRMLGTVLDITEYKRLQQQKDDFISVASHELKTPMTSIKASMQVLERLIKSGSGSPKVPEFVDRVNSNLAKMQQLVESLLNVSKISSGQFGLQKSTFNVAELIAECCDHVRMSGQYDLVVRGEMGVEIIADRYKIDQVIVNLVNNAVKYAPESKTIIIEIHSPPESFLKISVTDFGQGIPAAKLSHLFDRYYRVDSAGLQYSGLGLGLYICADIIKRHGGEIGVESEEGRGSTFWFTLPNVMPPG